MYGDVWMTTIEKKLMFYKLVAGIAISILLTGVGFGIKLSESQMEKMKIWNELTEIARATERNAKRSESIAFAVRDLQKLMLKEKAEQCKVLSYMFEKIKRNVQYDVNAGAIISKKQNYQDETHHMMNHINGKETHIDDIETFYKGALDE